MKNFNYFKQKGERYISTSMKKKNISEAAENLSSAIGSYQTARKFAKTEREIDYADRRISEIRRERKNLENITGETFHSFFAIASFVIALFFISFNLTGNSIGGINVSDLKWIGACFFLCGLFFTFVHLKGKRKF